MWVKQGGIWRADLGRACLTVQPSLRAGGWRWAASVSAPLCASTVGTVGTAESEVEAMRAAVAWLRDVHAGIGQALAKLDA